nr:retrotransposon protein, putative, Ty1-copia subclass [Tanacetum cinerariifolium]
MYVVSNKRAKLNLDSTLLWHCLLEHISKKHIEKLQHDGLLNSTDIKSFEKCVSCMSGKMARKPYSHQVERAKDLLGLIYTDVCGPFKIMSRQGASYFVTFTDNFSSYCYVYLLIHKHEVFETFKVFQKEVENQLGKTIKSLRSDCGGEYISQDFLDHLKEHGIIAHQTPPYTPQHNGVSDRRNRTLLDMVLSMMIQTTLLKFFWDYALDSAARILNMVPIKKVDKTPYKVWHRQAPKLSYLKVWCCEALVKRGTLTKPDKLELRSIKCVFVGYPKETMGYSFYYPPENKMKSMRDNKVWELVDLPPSGKTVGHKWLFKKKTNMDGAMHTYKARLVAKGFTQTSRIDYEETFSHVADIRAIRILIAIAAFYDYEIWQMNVKTAFLNGYLNEEVYMEQPEGFVNQKFPNRRMQNIPYASVVGSIMYVVRCTRLDVAFAQNMTSKFQQNPGELHWTTVKNILKYIRNTKDMFLVYGGDTKRELRVSCYTDVGYLTDADDHKSQTGYVFVLNGGVVDWKSTKQSIFATLSTDAECIASFYASKEALWIRKSIYGLGVVLTIEEPINMSCDNTGAIAIAKYHGKCECLLDVSIVSIDAVCYFNFQVGAVGIWGLKWTKPELHGSLLLAEPCKGYPKEMMGYSFNYPPENKVLVARNAEFLENCLIDQKASGSLEDLEIVQEEDTHPSLDTSLNHEEGDLEIDEPQSDIVPIRRSTRTRHAPD